VIGTGTEPGIFFNDGGDGDLFARTEHLFDMTLGGGEGGLDNSGGLALQYAYLDDTELEIVLRAVSKQERVEEITAPQLLLYNTQRGNLSVTNQISYIKDFEVEIAQAAAVADPVVGVVKDGIVLDVRPVVSADRKYITMELRPTLATLLQPIPTFTTTLGVGQPISIQLPRLTVQKVRTTVTIPDGGTLMLGGMKMAQKQTFESGVPFLKDIPLVSFLFSRKGTYIANKKILILLHASIVIPEEHEPVLRQPDDLSITRR
jgi:type II secretory pathway component GspD/PulD (secretin)